MYNSKFIFLVILMLIVVTILFALKKSKAGVKAGIFCIIGVIGWYLIRRIFFGFSMMRFRLIWSLNRITYNISFLVYVILGFIILYIIFKLFRKD